MRRAQVLARLVELLRGALLGHAPLLALLRERRLGVGLRLREPRDGVLRLRLRRAVGLLGLLRAPLQRLVARLRRGGAAAAGEVELRHGRRAGLARLDGRGRGGGERPRHGRFVFLFQFC